MKVIIEQQTVTNMWLTRSVSDAESLVEATQAILKAVEFNSSYALKTAYAVYDDDGQLVIASGKTGE